MFRLAAVVVTLLTSAVFVLPQLQEAGHDNPEQQAKYNLTALEENELKTGIIDNTEHPLKTQPVTIYPWGSKDTSVHSDETKQGDVLYNTSNTEGQSSTIKLTTEGKRDDSFTTEKASLDILPAANNLGGQIKLTTEGKQDDTSTTEKASPDMLPAANNLSGEMEISMKGELNSPLKLADASDIDQLASSFHGLLVKVAERKHYNSSHKTKEFLVKQSTGHSIPQIEKTTHKKQDPSSHQHGDLSTAVHSTSSSNVEVERSTQATLAVTSQKQENHTDVAFVPTTSSINLSTLIEITTDKKQNPSSHQHEDLSNVVQSIQSTSSSNVEVELTTERTSTVIAGKQEDHTDMVFIPTISSTNSSTLMEQTSERTSAVTSGKQEDHTDITFTPTISFTNLSTLMEQTTAKTSAVTPGKQEDHTDATFIPTMSSTNLSTMMEQTTERDSAVTSGKQEDYTDLVFTPNISSTNLSTLMEQTTERTSTVTSGKQDDHTDVTFTPTISSTNLSMLMEQTTERTSTATSGKQEDHADVAFTPTISSTILSSLMEETTTKILAVTPEKLEDHTDAALIPTISSTNLSTLMEISTKGELNSSLNLEDMSDIPQPASSLLGLRVQMPKIGEKKQDNSSHKQKQFLVKQSIDHSVSQVELTTQRTSTVASQKQEDHTDVTYMPTISSTNLSTLNVITMDKKRDPSSHQHGELSTVVQSTSSSNVEMEVAAEKNEGDLYQSLEDSSDVPNNTTSSENDLIVQMDPTNNGTQGNFSHNWEVSSIKTNSLNISTSDLNEQVDQGVEKEHKTNSHDIHPSASNSDAQVGMAANWELQKIPDKLKDLFVLISNMNFSASNTNEQMELISGKEHDNSSTNKQEDHIHVLHNLNMSPKNLAAQMELAADEEQDNLSHKQKDLSDINQGLNLSASNVNTEMGLTTIVPQQNSSHKLAVRSDFPRSLNISDSQFYAQIELSTEKEQEILPRKQKDLSDKVNTMNISASNLSAQVEVAVQNEQDNASQKQIDHSSSRSHVQMELADDKEHDSLSHEQDDTSDMPYNLNISSSNLDVQYSIFLSTVVPEENLYDTEHSTFNDHQFQILHFKEQLSKYPIKALCAFNENRSQDFQMEPLKQDKSYQKESYDGEPINMDLSASNLDVQMMEPADEEKDNSQQQENFYDMPFDLDQSALNTKEQMLEPTNEDEDNSHEEQFSLDLPVDLDQSASFITPQLPPQAEEKEIEDINERAFEMYPSSGNRNLRTQAKIREHKDINEAPFDQHQSASNENFGIPAEFEEDQDLSDGYFDAEESTNYENLGISREIRKHKDRYDEHFDVGQSPNDVNMDLSAENYDDTFRTKNPFDLELSTRNVYMKTPAKEKEYEPFDTQPIAMKYPSNNARVEQTTEVERERFHKAEDIYGFGRSAEKMEQTTEVKQERFQNTENVYDLGRSASEVHVQVAPLAEEERSYSVKPKGFNKKPSNFEYSTSKVNMDKLRNHQQNSLKEEDFYDVTPQTDQFADNLKVQYLVMSFNETKQNGVPKGNIINDIQERNISCPAEFAVLPDPDGDCNVYYICHNWTLERRTCSKDLHFNPINRVCDYPGKAVCDLKCVEENDRYHVPGYCNMYLDCVNGEGRYVRCSDGLHFNAITKQCDGPTKAACDIACPHYNTLVALPGRCNMYAICDEGNVTYHLCPPGLHFNPVTLKCDVPETEQCKIECLSANGYFPVLGQCMNYIECQNNHGKVISCPSGLHFNFLLQTCDVPSQAGCEMKCKEPNGYFPFPGVCSYFIMCVNGTPFLKKCPGDLEYNEDTHQCDIVTKNHCMPYCPMENGIFPVDNHCDLYMRCTHGQPLVKRCPQGLHFNALFKHCDLPENAKCELPCPFLSGMFPVPGKCNKFIRCENGVASTYSCAEGLHFNARTQTCDWPPSAQCDLSCPEWDGYFAVQGACNAYVMCNEGRPTLKKCPPGRHFNLEAKHCDYPEYANCEFVCPESDGLFAYRGHCDSYIHCENGKPHIDTCPPGLLFNIETAVCDLADNVRCYG